MRTASIWLAVAAFAALTVTGCGGSKKAAAPTPRGPAQPSPGMLVATLTASGHTPKVGRNWPITVTAHDRAGHPVKAHVQYLFLFHGAVVARRSNYAFSGRFHDNIEWPAQSAGLPLVFRALVASAIGTRALDYPVTVAR